MGVLLGPTSEKLPAHSLSSMECRRWRECSSTATSFCMSTDALSRRDFFNFAAAGIGGAALASLLARDGFAAAVPGEASDPPPHHAAKAKRVIHIVLCGGLS